MKSILVLTGLVLAACNALASPRSLLSDESRIEFTVKEMGVPVSGTFKRFEAAIAFDPAEPEKSSALVRIHIASLYTGTEEADAVALGSDWLDQEHAPYAVFESSSIHALGANRYEVTGMLKIRNKARKVVVRFDGNEQTGGKTILTGEFVIKRSEFGIGGGVWNEGDVVGEEVSIKVTLSLAPGTTGRAASVPR